MANVFAGAAAFILVIVLWGLGRRPSKPLIRSTDASNVAALNRDQLSLVETSLKQQSQPQAPRAIEAPQGWEPPKTIQERLVLKRTLREAMALGPDQRLEAVKQAAEWRHKSMLPILRQGLRDTDSRVVAAAAEAINRYRVVAKRQGVQRSLLPRNVARMR